MSDQLPDDRDEPVTPAGPEPADPPSAPDFQAPYGSEPETPAPGGYDPTAGGYQPPADPYAAQNPGYYGEPPAGSYPPPPGGYQPPSDPYGQAPGYPPAGGFDQGGFPPPPPSDPYPPAGGYGEPLQPPSASFSVGEAFNYGWRKFQAHLGPILLVTLVALVVPGAIGGLGGFVAGLTARTDDPFGGLSTFGTIVMMLFTLVGMVVGFVISVGLVRAALDITHGREVSLQTVFRLDNLVQPLIASLIIGVGTTIGSYLCVIPGLLVVFFTQFTLHFVVDKNLPAWEAIKASASLVNRNLGSLVGLYFASLLAAIVGALLCGIGLLAAIPVILIATAFAYRKLQGEYVAP